MTKRFILTRDFGDIHEPCNLGFVEIEYKPGTEIETEEDAKQLIKRAWEDFKATEPDSESQFVEYLKTNYYVKEIYVGEEIILN